MFVNLGRASDGSGVLQANLQGRLRRAAGASSYTVVPIDDQTSIFVRTRETTSLVKPEVVA